MPLAVRVVPLSFLEGELETRRHVLLVTPSSHRLGQRASSDLCSVLDRSHRVYSEFYQTNDRDLQIIKHAPLRHQILCLLASSY